MIDKSKPYLTTNDLKIVKMLASGWRAKEVAVELDVCEATMRQCLFRARKRARCKTTFQLMAFYGRATARSA